MTKRAGPDDADRAVGNENPRRLVKLHSAVQNYKSSDLGTASASLLHFTAALDSVFNVVYDRSLRLVNSPINSNSITLHDVFYTRAPSQLTVLLGTTVFMDGSTLIFILNKI